MNKVGCFIFKNTMDVVCFVVSTNYVIMNCLCGDMKVETFYVKSLHKTEP